MRHTNRLLARWGHICIVCGNGFDSLECVSREHIIPRSMGGRGRMDVDNIAPSHFSCNQFRKSDSLIVAAKKIAALKEYIGEKNFKEWLNKKIPGKKHWFIPVWS